MPRQKVKDYHRLKKLNDPAKYDRPWKEMNKQVRYLPNYALPKPYQRVKLWFPGDNEPTRSAITGEPRPAPVGAPSVRTKIMPADSGHHPYGPSILSAYSLPHGGCSNHIPHKGMHPMAEVGSVKHAATVDGNLERLGGIKEWEEEVTWAREAIGRLYDEGFKDAKYGGREDRKFDGEEFIECTMGIEGLNFGTVDRLRFSSDGMRAIVIDLKFGAWPVTLAKKNLQLLNYAVYAFFCKRPIPHSVTVALVHVKSRTVSTHTYWRRAVYLLKAKIAKVIARAERGRTNPEEVGYHPNPSNCAWCERINCVARLDLASSIVSLWKKEPIVLPRPELLTISLEQLGLLKSFVNVLQRLVDAVNDECKRRAFDEDQVVPGYEIKQRSGRRRIVGLANIGTACKLVMDEWPKWFPNNPLDLGELAVDTAELGVDDLEQAAQKAAPYGKVLRAKELVAQLLNNPALVQSNMVYYLAAKIPKQKEE